MRKLNSTLRTLCVCGIGMLSVAMMGCANDPGQQRSQQAVTGLQDTQKKLVNGRKQVDTVIASSNALSAGAGDLPAQFKKFKWDLADLESTATSVAAQDKAMRAQATEYRSKWETEMGDVSDPDLRKAADARVAAVKEGYNSISDKMHEASVAYKAFDKDCTSLQTYLSNDLTSAGIKAASATFAKINESGKVLNMKLDALTTEINGLSTTMAPAKK